MRPDREVRYCITVQQYNRGDNSLLTTGIVSQKFGLGDKTSRSEVRITWHWSPPPPPPPKKFMSPSLKISTCKGWCI
jgi:hypothetical protein